MPLAADVSGAHSSNCGERVRDSSITWVDEGHQPGRRDPARARYSGTSPGQAVPQAARRRPRHASAAPSNSQYVIARRSRQRSRFRLAAYGNNRLSTPHNDYIVPVRLDPARARGRPDLEPVIASKLERVRGGGADPGPESWRSLTEGGPQGSRVRARSASLPPGAPADPLRARWRRIAAPDRPSLRPSPRRMRFEPGARPRCCRSARAGATGAAGRAGRALGGRWRRPAARSSRPEHRDRCDATAP